MKEIRHRDLAGRELQRLATPEGVPSRLKTIAFSPAGDAAIGASGDGNAYVWRLGGGEQPVMTQRGHTAAVARARFAPVYGWMITASEDHTARVFDREGTTVAILVGHGGGGVQDAHVSSDGRRAFTASRDGTVRVWILDRRELEALARKRRAGGR